MSNIVRWDPFREMMSLRQMMNRVFDESFDRQLGRTEDWSIPSIDMYQTEKDVIVKAVMPGMKPEDIQISVTGDVLTLRGEVKKEQEIKEANYHLQERHFGSFSRSIPLPVSVVTDQAHAEFENGILTLTLPKSEVDRPKTITVKVK
ncbi:heat shock protein Hsp20 [Longilinea arvoryzae]|uniref:Heat shock protein Hsp20 n=1 Tax=Longilinea arvoryzae TaxID=360412 RepID=A0A0S7BLH9_9CHLR|nr:Hsp20/alpha crystallin family protein [Longilinea arvoryzae]GAP14613.1 heat shock protein Hsp20 [Longilinea arvoryzae]